MGLRPPGARGPGGAARDPDQDVPDRGDRDVADPARRRDRPFRRARADTAGIATGLVDGIEDAADRLPGYDAEIGPEGGADDDQGTRGIECGEHDIALDIMHAGDDAFGDTADAECEPRADLFACGERTADNVFDEGGQVLLCLLVMSAPR